MPRFRSAKSQAEHAVSCKIALGQGRHDNRGDGRIHSLGTARGYEQALKGFAEYIRDHRLGDLGSATVKEAEQYLVERAGLVAQKTLDLDRQAIQMHLGIQLEVNASLKQRTGRNRTAVRSSVMPFATEKAERVPSADLRGALTPAKHERMATITEPKKIGQLLRAIDGYEGTPVAKCALELAPLFSVRPGELRHAEWSEIDLDSAEWRIPAAKMKMKDPHIVPLSHHKYKTGCNRKCCSLFFFVPPACRHNQSFPPDKYLFCS